VHDLQFAKDLLPDGRFGVYKNHLYGPASGINAKYTSKVLEYLLGHERLSRDVHDFGDCPAIPLTEFSDGPKVFLPQAEPGPPVPVGADLQASNLFSELSVVALPRPPRWRIPRWCGRIGRRIGARGLA
jgi:hypothetical protein